MTKGERGKKKEKVRDDCEIQLYNTQQQSAFLSSLYQACSSVIAARYISLKPQSML